jgi:Protein of unknown function (DUF3040)
MSLNCRQQRQLRYIEASVRRTDPDLGAMLGIFGRLYPEEDLPAWEQESREPASQSRIRRVGAWIVAALSAVTAAIEVLLGRAATVATARRRARAQVPAARDADQGQNHHVPDAREQHTKRKNV